MKKKMECVKEETRGVNKEETEEQRGWCYL